MKCVLAESIGIDFLQEYQAQSLKLVAERAPTVLLEVSLAAEMIEIYEENT